MVGMEEVRRREEERERKGRENQVCRAEEMVRVKES